MQDEKNIVNKLSDTPEINFLQPDDKRYQRNRKIISLVSLGLIIILFGVITCTGGRQLLDFISQPETLREWISQNQLIGALAMAGIMCMQVVIVIMPGELVEISAGYAFGSIGGMCLCLLGAAVGGAIIYIFTKRWGSKMVEAFISKEKMQSLSFIKNTDKLRLLVFVLFLIPGSPKDMITYFIGLTPMRLPSFLIISSIARIPSVISSTIGGDAIGEGNYMLAIIVFVITAVISLIGLLIYRRISYKKHI